MRLWFFFLFQGGTVFTFGSGRYGQLGHNSFNDELQPRVVTGLECLNVSQITCGGYVLCLLICRNWMSLQSAILNLKRYICSFYMTHRWRKMMCVISNTLLYSVVHNNSYCKWHNLRCIVLQHTQFELRTECYF